MKVKISRKQIVQVALVAASISPFAGAAGLPRGADVGTLAANCNIGPFPQMSKAGGYNVLCDTMQDAEKCLALVKRHFNFDGTNVTVEPVSDHEQARAAYCLDVLKRDLHISAE